MEAQAPLMRSTLLLDRFGDVVLTLDSDGLAWAPVAPPGNKSEKCLGLIFSSKYQTDIKFLDTYAVEFIDWGPIHELIYNIGAPLPCHQTEMYRFVVHGFQKSRGHRSMWVLASYTFGHRHLQTCQTWFEQINNRLNMEASRPKNLWIFVHPLSGKGNGRKTWQTVAPIFSRAKVKTKVTVTERAGHAYDLVNSITDEELSSLDGIVAVGGDGFFSEILNGLLLSRHNAPYPPVPVEFMHSVGSDGENENSRINCENKSTASTHSDGSLPGVSYKNEDVPLLSASESSIPRLSNYRKDAEGYNADQDLASFFPNERFRLGIIPAGSTDAIVISTTGARDPVTSALHIILGKKIRVDISQVVRWEDSVSSSVRYAASFAGYGFYGDVIKESEKYRWMGPKRYDYAGTRVFLEHRSYEAEVAFLEDTSSRSAAGASFRENVPQQVEILGDKPPKTICRVNCASCKETTSPAYLLTSCDSDLRWLRSKGRFLSVGAAVISCRNGRAPDGLVADAHLADGFLHLILIKDCPRPLYLWHLTKLTRKGSNPLDFAFVERHKTQAFTFISSGKESVWNLDGELFQARKLSVQVFQGLVSLFAAGPED
uniref:Ceramide kinase n=1 Tax=Anthurium amnicola TaxID=1678845 RepID=A0A1D1XWP5_9ARAE